MKIGKFLDLIGSKLKEDRPDVPTTFNYSIKQYGNVINFWFRTQGCKYTKNGYGGCLVCDYSSSSQPPVDEQIKYIKQGLDEIKKMTPYILINASGSFFDNNEVPKNVRVAIYNKLSQYKELGLILETLLETITENKLINIREILKTQTIHIEFGVESCNLLFQKYSVNKKNLNLNSLNSKIKLIHKYNMSSVANVLVGLPFLSEKEIIDESVKTIHKIIDLGISYIVVFPVNIKPYTTLYWLYKNNLYKNISLWSYIEVLNQIESKYLTKIELSWYQNRKSNNSLYKDGFRTPITCKKCNDKVLSLLDSFTYNSNNREETLFKINSINCECKQKWYEKLEEKSDFKENVKIAYEKMAIDILGENFWITNKKNLIKEIDNDFRKNNTL